MARSSKFNCKFATLQRVQFVIIISTSICRLIIRHQCQVQPEMDTGQFICQTTELCSFLAVKAHILRCRSEMATQ